MSSINYQYSPIPQKEIKNKIYKLYAANDFKVMDGIVNEIYLFPETRASMKKRLSFGFLAEKLNLGKATVWRIVRKLKKQGVVKILEKGRRKIGSLVLLVVDKINDLYEIFLQQKSFTCGTNKKFSKACESKNISSSSGTNETTETEPVDIVNRSNSETNKAEISSTCGTNKSEIGSTCGTKQKTILKNNNNNPEPPPKGVVSSYIKNLKKTAKNVVENFFPSSPQNSNFTSLEQVIENLPGQQEIISEPSPQACTSRACTETETRSETVKRQIQNLVTIEGVTEKIFAIGIKALKNRNITKIEKALEDIKAEMAVRDMTNPKAYFLHLCRVKDDFTFTENKKTPVDKIAERTEKYFKKIEEEKVQQEDCNEILKGYKEKHPEKVIQIIKKVENRPGTKFITLPEIKATLYVQEFRKQFPELV